MGLRVQEDETNILLTMPILIFEKLIRDAGICFKALVEVSENRKREIVHRSQQSPVQKEVKRWTLISMASQHRWSRSAAAQVRQDQVRLT